MNLSYYNDPFPHIIGSLDTELYEEVCSSWKNINHTSFSEIAGKRSNIPLTDKSIISKLNPILFHCYETFLPSIFTCYPKLIEKKGITLTPKILYSQNDIFKNEYKIRGLHLDTGEKIIIGLWYFKNPEEIDDGGDLILMNPISKDTKIVKYDSNLFIAFPNITTAWHAVTPRKASKYPRNYINLLLESSDVKLHNYQRVGNSIDNEFRDKLINYYEVKK